MRSNCRWLWWFIVLFGGMSGTLSLQGQDGDPRIAEWTRTVTEPLTHANEARVLEAIESLGKAGASAAPAVPRLCKLAAEPSMFVETKTETTPGGGLKETTITTFDSKVGEAACLALGGIGDPRALSALMDLLEKEHADRAVPGLVLLGAPATKRLLPLAVSPKDEVRTLAIRALKSLPIQLADMPRVTPLETAAPDLYQQLCANARDRGAFQLVKKNLASKKPELRASGLEQLEAVLTPLPCEANGPGPVDPELEKEVVDALLAELAVSTKDPLNRAPNILEGLVVRRTAYHSLRGKVAPFKITRESRSRLVTALATLDLQPERRTRLGNWSQILGAASAAEFTPLERALMPADRKTLAPLLLQKELKNAPPELYVAVLIDLSADGKMLEPLPPETEDSLFTAMLEAGTVNDHALKSQCVDALKGYVRRLDGDTSVKRSPDSPAVKSAVAANTTKAQLWRDWYAAHKPTGPIAIKDTGPDTNPPPDP